MVMEAFILGTGGSMPLPRRHLTSALLRREGELFLFDAGEGTQVSLKRLNLRWKNISCIFISHTHADHVTGLPGMIMLSSQVEREEPLYIIGPPRIREYVESSCRILQVYLNYELRIIEIEEPWVPQTVFKGSGYSVRSFPLKHTRVCVGYSFIEDNRPGVFNSELAEKIGIPRGPVRSQLQNGETVMLENGRKVKPSEVLGNDRPGRKFCYVTDTLPLDSIAEEVKHSDLLLIEGMFEQELCETAASKGHMTAVEAARIAKRAQARMSALTHFSPRYTKRELVKLLNEARTEYSKVSLAEDGQTIPITYPRVPLKT